MYKDPQTPSKFHRNIAIGFSVGFVIVIALVVVVVLRHAQSSSSSTSMGAAGVSAQVALSQYEGSVPELKSSYTKSTTPVSYSLQYKSNDHNYSISLVTSGALSFYANSKSQTDDSHTIQQQTQSYMKSQGFQIINQPSYATTGESYITYQNKTTVCQLNDTAALIGAFASHTFACIPLTDVVAEYTTIEQLVALYTKENTLPTFTKADRNLITSGNKSLSILRLTTESSQPSLLFVAVSGKWQYITELSDGSSADSNGKYVPSAAITAAFNNPTYGSFVKASLN